MGGKKRGIIPQVSAELGTTGWKIKKEDEGRSKSEKGTGHGIMCEIKGG